MYNILKKFPVAKKDAILLTFSGIFILISLLPYNNFSKIFIFIVGLIGIVRGIYKWKTSPKLSKQIEIPLFK
jgi:uncharacterized membrane protein